MIRIKRLEITAHLRDPRAPLIPATSHTLPFVYQLVSEDCRIIAIKNSRDCIAACSNFLDVLVIKSASSLVRVKLHRLFFVDAERLLVVICAFNARPAQVLRDAARIAPPVNETQLHADILARGFGDHLIEKNKLSL